jgi:hypothetical protein
MNFYLFSCTVHLTSPLSKNIKIIILNNSISFIKMSSGSEETEESDASWIAWYCGLKGNEFLCEVKVAYILNM